jgi:hypothetical protein
MQRKGDQSHHDDHRCEDRDDVTVAPLAKASSGPFVAHGWFLAPLNRAHLCLGLHANRLYLLPRNRYFDRDQSVQAVRMVGCAHGANLLRF